MAAADRKVLVASFAMDVVLKGKSSSLSLVCPAERALIAGWWQTGWGARRKQQEIRRTPVREVLGLQPFAHSATIQSYGGAERIALMPSPQSYGHRSAPVVM